MIKFTRAATPFSRRCVLAAGVLVGAVHLSAPAAAQMVCMQRDAIRERLEANYGETPKANGLANAGIVELYTSDKGTFTLVLTLPDGRSCLMAVGAEWEPIKEPKSAGI